MSRSTLAFAFILAASAQSLPPPPPTPKHPVIETYHGVSVTDNYRWLEDWSNPAVRAWSEVQNTYARRYLDRLPDRLARLRALYSQPSPRFYGLAFRHSVLFAIKRQPPKDQPLLVTLPSLSDPTSARVLVDPNTLDPSGHTAIDFYVPSPDGRFVAVSLSQGGSENGELRVYDVASASPLPDVIPRVNRGTAGGSLAWTSASSSFYYTRYPAPGECPAADLDFYQQVWFHTLGSNPSSDRYSLGRGFPRIAEIALDESPDGRTILARMANGDGGEFAHYLLTTGGEWTQIATLADEVVSIHPGPDGSLYLLSRHQAPMGAILKTPIGRPSLASARTVVPESSVAIQDFAPSAGHLYISGVTGGPSRLRVFSLDGRAEGEVPLRPVSDVIQILAYSNGRLLFEQSGFLDPPAWFSFDPSTHRATPTVLRESSPTSFADLEVLRDTAVSSDGTKIPLNIIRPTGTKLDGSHRVLLYAYGGYGISSTPGFLLRERPLFDRGFIYVVANIRGGGEFGEAWHRAGMLTRKQNVFDDFAASARYLIDHGYTTPARLAIEGGSNGGLLMGAALTQHSGLFRAVVSHVGIYDMLRVELSPNGAFNVTEFGTVKEADQFHALFAYSPYHHVRDGAQYPAILFLTGVNDPRVDPANSRKMTARLQASGTGLPVLLRTSSTSGHGIGSSLSDVLEQEADVDAFLLAQIPAP